MMPLKLFFIAVLDRSISLKVSLETRLKSEFLEPLIDFLAFSGSNIMV